MNNSNSPIGLYNKFKQKPEADKKPALQEIAIYLVLAVIALLWIGYSLKAQFDEAEKPRPIFLKDGRINYAEAYRQGYRADTLQQTLDSVNLDKLNKGK